MRSSAKEGAARGICDVGAEAPTPPKNNAKPGIEDRIGGAVGVDVRIAMAQHVLKDTALIPIAETLAARAEQARSLDEVRKKDLRAGDRVLVKTKNSLYTIWVLDADVYRVSGGWFDLRGMAPQRMAINGCTWGGTAIKQDILAACGLRLEFGNTVLTTRIREIRVIPAEVRTSLN